MVSARATVMHDASRALHVTPIGTIHSPHGERVEAPRQPRAAERVAGTVELFPGHGYEDALADLATFSHLWLIVWFDRNRGYRPKVSPPRSTEKRGVFATRAPYRPNPIGLSAVELVAIEGLVLHVRGLDLLDGTPLLDLKPYVPYTDAIPDASHGWLEHQARDLVATRPVDPLARFTIAFAPEAEAQLAWLETEHGLSLRTRIEAQLALGPAPHAYRRIRQVGDRFRLALKDWRAWFRVEGTLVTVEQLGSGYRARELFSDEGGAPAVHRAFVARYPSAPLP